LHGRRMDDFDGRLGPHEVLCSLIKMDLRRKGWIVESFGQGQLSAAMRMALQACTDWEGQPTGLRWLPDLIAVGGPLAVLIDAKSGETWRTTGNLSIEKAALAAAVRFSHALKIDVYFIFTDGSAISARELDHGVKWDGQWRGRGSNTPFWLFQKGDTRPCLDLETVYPAELIACDWADLVWVSREEIAGEIASLREPGE
jgi:hypothetical protein